MTRDVPPGPPATRPVDWLAALAAVLAGVMAVVYVLVVQAQDETPAAWFLVTLAAAWCLCTYGAARRSPHRRGALTTGGILLLLLGVLGILTIGLPIIAAGALAMLASARST
jgi:hypothetical protein